jgi:hypothetical protein
VANATTHAQQLTVEREDLQRFRSLDVLHFVHVDRLRQAAHDQRTKPRVQQVSLLNGMRQ